MAVNGYLVPDLRYIWKSETAQAIGLDGNIHTQADGILYTIILTRLAASTPAATTIHQTTSPVDMWLADYIERRIVMVN
jgi:hypothetical protein